MVVADDPVCILVAWETADGMMHTVSLPAAMSVMRGMTQELIEVVFPTKDPGAIPR